MEQVQCAKCQTSYSAFPFERLFGRRRCPKCRSTARVYTALLQEGMRLFDAWKGSIKNKNYARKKKLRGWFFSGYEWSHDLGKFVHKFVHAEKRTDEYHELVTDPDTGQVIHECKESLRKHVGHGSAKFKHEP